MECAPESSRLRNVNLENDARNNAVSLTLNVAPSTGSQSRSPSRNLKLEEKAEFNRLKTRTMKCLDLQVAVLVEHSLAATLDSMARAQLTYFNFTSFYNFLVTCS